VPVLSRSEDIANARLHFEDGCVANVTASRISPRADAQDSDLSGGRVSLARLSKSSGEIYRRVGKKIWRDRVEIEHGEPLKLQLTSFIECANHGTTTARLGFSSHGSTGTGSQNYEANLVECMVTATVEAGVPPA